MIKKNFRDFFPIFQKNNDLVYFDHSTTSLKPKQMIDALMNFYNHNGLSAKSFYHLSYENHLLIENVRKKISIFINANAEEIIFTKSTTESLNMIAFGLSHLLKEGDEIITSELEHNSSFLPWLRISKQTKSKIIFIPLDKYNKITVNNFKKVLSSKTKIVVLTHISNVLGNITPIQEITRLAHEKNILVILDSAQYVGHYELNVYDLGVDFLAFSAHKMYGPFGLGILFIKSNLINLFRPLLLGGGIIKSLEYNCVKYKKNYLKLEAGTYNISSIISFGATLDFISNINFKTIIKHEKKIYLSIIEQLKKISDIEIYNLNSDSNIIAFNLKNIHAHDVATFLDQENICVRSGKHCANLTLNKIKQKSVVRISIGLYNNEQDVVFLISALKKIQKIFKNKLF